MPSILIPFDLFDRSLEIEQVLPIMVEANFAVKKLIIDLHAIEDLPTNTKRLF